MEKLRRATAEITWAGRSITGQLGPFFESLTFFDSAQKGAKDELVITLDNSDGRFYEAWYPEEGDHIQAEIVWTEKGRRYTFPLGLFTIDRPDFTIQPARVKVRALSYQSLKRDNLRRRTNRAWVNVTLKAAVTALIKEAGYRAVVECPAVQLPRLEIRDETPEQALTRLAREFNCLFNVKGEAVVFTNDKRPSGLTLDLGDHRLIIGGELGPKPRAVYAAATISYYDPETGKVVGHREEAEGAAGDTVLELHDLARTLEEARERCRAALGEANRKTAGGSLSIMGRPISAGTIIELAGLGRLSGPYLVKRAAHTLTKKRGWKTRLRLEVVENGD